MYCISFLTPTLFLCQTLVLICAEALDHLTPNQTILRPGVKVQIGLDKSTKLSAVFDRYVEICNLVGDGITAAAVAAAAAAASGTAGGNNNNNNVQQLHQPGGFNDVVGGGNNNNLVAVADIINRNSGGGGSGRHRKSGRGDDDNAASKQAAALAAAIPSKVTVDELEFMHVQLLNGNDTPEAAALMKNDKISVRPDRSKQREQQRELDRIQRAGDVLYFEELRQLSRTDPYNDVVLDCQSTLDDEVLNISVGYNNNEYRRLLTSNVIKCQSALMKRRCPWLYEMIETARRDRLEDMRRQAEENINLNNNKIDDGDDRQQVPDNVDDVDDMDQDDNDRKFAAVRDELSQLSRQAPSEEEDDIMDHHDHNNNNINRANDDADRDRNAATIENDDDEDDGDDDGKQLPMQQYNNNNANNEDMGVEQNGRDIDNDNENCLRVIIHNHAPQPVHMLMEYCTTNRVVMLGKDAFVEACKTEPDCKKIQGPVPPYPVGGTQSSKRWPHKGEPLVSFTLVVATLKLAHEAGLPRLALMCEIASAQLVEPLNVVQALKLCQEMSEEYDNPLPKLRQAAVAILLQATMASDRFKSIPGFRKALKDQAQWLVPPLLMGTMETVMSLSQGNNGNVTPPLAHGQFQGHHSKHHGNQQAGWPSVLLLSGSKRDWRTMALSNLDEIDRLDIEARSEERQQRRSERQSVVLEDFLPKNDMDGADRQLSARALRSNSSSHRPGVSASVVEKIELGLI